MFGDEPSSEGARRCARQTWRLLIVAVVIAGMVILIPGPGIAVDQPVADDSVANGNVTGADNNSVASGTTVYAGGQDGQILAFDVGDDSTVDASTGAP
jgi:hypothetical protein